MEEPQSENIKSLSDKAQESEQRFTNAFEYAAIGMALVSLEGKWIKVNHSVCDLLGYSERELMGMTFQDVTHPDDLDKDLENVRMMLSGEIKTYEMQKRYFHKSKRIVWVRLSVSLVKSQRGDPLYFISQIEDITDRKRMIEQLRDNEQRLRLATTSAQLGIWDLNIETNTLIWDDQMYRLYGVKRESFHPTVESWERTIHPDDLVKTTQNYQDAMKGEKEFNTEFRVIWPDGTERILKGTAQIVRNSNGKPIRMTGVNHDITKDKRAFESLKELNTYLDDARRVAEDATAVKSRFLDIAAHELRTPVTSFSLLLQLAQKRFESGCPVEAGTLTRLRLQSDRISRLVVDLLEVSRLERGVLVLKLEEVDIVSHLSDCLNDFKLRFPERNITITKPSAPIKIKIDPVRIYQVLTNLLDNAVKFTSKETPIEITIKKLLSRVQVSVKDYGNGIPEEQKEGLFTIFSRGSMTLTERSGGLGLGLFICRSIIELHGGKIYVSSKVGNGSTFTFELPLEE